MTDPSFDIIENSIANPEGRLWSLRVTAQPAKTNPGLGHYHSFLVLTDETGPGDPVALDELHFLPKNSRNDVFKGRSARILRKINGAVAAAGLQDTFQRAAGIAGLGRYVFSLTGFTRRGSMDKLAPEKGLNSVACASGTPREMLRAWNDACRAALEINRIKPLFTIGTRTGDTSCRAGAKAVLESAGYAFQDVVAGRPRVADLSSRFRVTHPRGQSDAQLLADYLDLQKRLWRDMPQAAPRAQAASVAAPACPSLIAL